MEKIISKICGFFWGDILTLQLGEHISIGISLLVLILIPSGIYFTIKTRFLPIRYFKEMLKISVEKQDNDSSALSGMQSLIVSTATRVGMGNMVGVVAAISVGGPGAVFWMWITALIGSSTAFIEGTLAQIYKVEDKLYGGFKGGPAYYIHSFFNKGKKYNIIAVAFALSGLLCWCGVSQVIGNSITSAFYNAFEIPPIITISFVALIAAIIVFKKSATVKVLDVVVPVMAAIYFIIAIVVIIMNITILPNVLQTIISEAFGLTQIVSGGIGAALMNGVKRGLFSNEAGSGSAPCASAASDVSHPAKAGLFQAFGVLIDTIVICTCTAMIMLLVPSDVITGKEGLDLLQSAMGHHFGNAGIYFVLLRYYYLVSPHLLVFYSMQDQIFHTCLKIAG